MVKTSKNAQHRQTGNTADSEVLPSSTRKGPVYHVTTYITSHHQVRHQEDTK